MKSYFSNAVKVNRSSVQSKWSSDGFKCLDTNSSNLCEITAIDFEANVLLMHIFPPKHMLRIITTFVLLAILT